MRHSYSVLAFGALVAGAVAFSGPAHAATGADYFNGKTVTWIVATGSGGGQAIILPHENINEQHSSIAAL